MPRVIYAVGGVRSAAVSSGRRKARSMPDADIQSDFIASRRPRSPATCSGVAQPSPRGRYTMNAPTSITITPVFVADLSVEGERMPVYVHVIDHPDARVLVGTA